MTTPRARILAIDDTPANLHTLGAVLEGGFELQFATSSPAGTVQSLKSPPDLILLDSIAGHASINRQHILVVEDERLVARDIVMQLKDIGFEALGPVSTGEEALEIAAQLRPTWC